MAGFLRRPPLASPREGTRFALEGPNDRVRDPATVERARLRARPFIVDPTLVHERRVERDHSGECAICRRRIGVAPRSSRNGTTATSHDVVVRPALPLAPVRALIDAERFSTYVRRWEVVVRWMARLEHAQPGCRLCDRRSAENYSQPRLDGLQPRWAWVIPHRLLAELRLDPTGCGSSQVHDDNLTVTSKSASAWKEIRLNTTECCLRIRNKYD